MSYRFELGVHLCNHRMDYGTVNCISWLFLRHCILQKMPIGLIQSHKHMRISTGTVLSHTVYILWRLQLGGPVSMGELQLIVMTHSTQCVNCQMMRSVFQRYMAYILLLFRKWKDEAALWSYDSLAIHYKQITVKEAQSLWLSCVS